MPYNPLRLKESIPLALLNRVKFNHVFRPTTISVQGITACRRSHSATPQPI